MEYEFSAFKLAGHFAEKNYTVTPAEHKFQKFKGSVCLNLKKNHVYFMEIFFYSWLMTDDTNGRQSYSNRLPFYGFGFHYSILFKLQLNWRSNRMWRVSNKQKIYS